MGIQFNSQVTREVAAVLGVELKHASTKHAQTFGMLERTHATVKTQLKSATAEFRDNWNKFLPLVDLNHFMQVLDANQFEYSTAAYHTTY